MYDCGTLRLIMSKCKICKTCGSEYSELNFKKYCSRKCYEIRPGGFNIKNYGRFTNSSGSKIWSEEFKPKLLEKIPFCEPLKEPETNFKLN